MLTFKMSAVLDRLITGTDQHDVYIIRDIGIVFYVGMTRKGVISRLHNHFGWSGNQSSLGKLVFANLPQSREWTIELLTKEECECETAKAAETKTIKRLRPRLNIWENGGGYKLPEKYNPPATLDLQNSPSDLIVIGKSQF